MGVLVIWLMLLVIFGCYSYRYLEKRNAISLKWPAEISDKKLVRYCRLYLRADGWTTLEEWGWIYVYIRARKGDTELNLRVADVSTLGWETIFRDLNEVGIRANAVVGVISASPLPSWVVEAADLTGSFVMAPSDLPHAAILVAEAKQRYRDILLKIRSKTYSDPINNKLETLVPKRAKV